MPEKAAARPMRLRIMLANSKRTLPLRGELLIRGALLVILTTTSSRAEHDVKQVRLL
jgi:hypothetical protein